MVDKTISLKLEAPTEIALRPVDNSPHTAIIFKMKDGLSGALLPDQDLSAFTALIIKQAVRVAAKRPSQIARKKTLTTDPLVVSRLQLSPGRSKSEEALLIIEIGNLTMTFSVTVSELVELYKDANRQATREKPQR